MNVKSKINKILDFASHQNALRVERKKFKDNDRKNIF